MLEVNELDSYMEAFLKSAVEQISHKPELLRKYLHRKALERSLKIIKKRKNNR